jgi:hypothetical protein
MPPQQAVPTPQQPPLDFSSIEGHQLHDEGDLPDTQAQARAQFPRPQYMAPLEDFAQGTKLGKANDQLSDWLSKQEGKVSEKYLRPFREGLDRMGSDLREAASTEHTRTGGQLTPTTRLLVGAVGNLLPQVPVGSDIPSTIEMAVTPPEFGVEGKALSRELKSAQRAEKTLDFSRIPGHQLHQSRHIESPSAASQPAKQIDGGRTLPAEPRGLPAHRA